MDARRRQDDLKWWNRRIALSVVEAAVRKVGPEADARTVRSEAIRLLLDEVDSMPEEKSGKYDIEDIATAIKYLIKGRDAPSGIISLAHDEPRYLTKAEPYAAPPSAVATRPAQGDSVRRLSGCPSPDHRRASHGRSPHR